jgi:hypothetical protein
MKKSTPSTCGINVGVSKETVAEARGAINDILSCEAAEQRTKQKALSTLRSLCEVGNTAISNCNITVN